MVKQIYEDSYGISVPKEYGEKILKYLKENEILALNLQILRDSDNLIIPVVKQPDLEKLQILFELQNSLRLVEQKFPYKKKRHSSIADALMGEIPPNLVEFQPVAFDQIGSIAVVDIKDEVLPYTEKIGTAIFNLHPSINAVYRKSKAVSGVTRLRGLELIAGSEVYETIHKEHGIKIFVDLRNIYFSPRLSTEHNRIANLVNENEVVFDMFGAAAPFALHISTLHNAKIFTLDINESAPKIIKKSIQLNPKLKGDIKILTGDANAVCSDLIKEGVQFDRIIMNHPSDSTRYLQLANKLLKKRGYIHFYSFVTIENHDDICSKIIKEELPGYQIVEIVRVRQYSPKESHTCITIRKK
ncbi:MAG: class I SAM-dependent methyltransferase [Candidatus Kariarchaeaceae archaeon]|jgi:tRNA (guanine37-N1)-methyltransferase